MQDRYLKLTDAQLDLATSFQRWQYRGFEIDGLNIYFEGKPVFTSRFLKLQSVEQCKNIIDQSLAMKAIQDAPRIKKRTTGPCELENGSAEGEKFSEWANDQAELQMDIDNL